MYNINANNKIMPKFPEEGGMPYKPFKMKGAFKDASTDAHPHQHLKMTKELKDLPPAPPYKPFKMKGFPFHNPEHAENKKQTVTRLQEEGYSQEEIDIIMRTGEIPQPGAKNEQMMQATPMPHKTSMDYVREAYGKAAESEKVLLYKPLKHYSVKKGSHKHPHKKK